ncbi:MAG: TIGR02444 family protein [Hyphomicrobiaceae bacterium]
MTSVDEYQAALWAFSLDRYTRPGVSDRCLTLQDSLGADVNVLLLCLWRGQHGADIPETVLQDCLQGNAGAWHRDVVQPIRSARRAMKGRTSAGDSRGVETCRDQLKRIEIECERLEQQMLVAALAATDEFAVSAGHSKKSCVEKAIANVTRYLRLITAVPSPDFDDQVKGLVVACID